MQTRYFLFLLVVVLYVIACSGESLPVVTVEPGIYFIPTLMDRWRAEGKFTSFINYDAFDAYRDFGGVRIEDDVLVLDDGYRVLGRPIPRTIDEVEAEAAR